MEEPTKLFEPESIEEAELTGLVELQKFLADELDGFQPQDPKTLKRAFRPITDGLGLDAPKMKDSAKIALQDPPFDVPPLRPIERPVVQPPPLPPVAEKTPISNLREALSGWEDENAKKQRVTTAPVQVAPEKIKIPEFTAPAVPLPTSPRAPLWARIQSGVLDQVFVLTLWVAFVVLAANLLSGFKLGVGIELLRELAKPPVLRLAALGFAFIWLTYLSVCLGFFGTTFGMWVWAIRVQYDQRDEEIVFFKKLGRVIASFIFMAPIAPSLLLLVQFNGKNLVDWITGSRLVRKTQSL